METLQELTRRHPRQGTVHWIGIRPKRRAPMTEVDSVAADSEQGLIGDRYQGKRGTRQVTLIQAEHLAAMAAMLGRDELLPETLRRNVVIAGINLLSLKDRRFQIGEAVLAYTGLCHPCSHMEEVLGPGGYNIMRGHGGITARVLESGSFACGDKLVVLQDEAG